MACPTCGGMFANNTKFLDHIRRQTSLDRKLSEEGEWVQAVGAGWGHIPRGGAYCRYLQLGYIYL